MAANIGQSTDSQTSRHASPFLPSLYHPWSQFKCCPAFASLPVHKTSSWAAGAVAETQSKAHSCSCTCQMPLGELLDLCVCLLIHCPICQSKLTYLLEFCAVLHLEFRHSLLGGYLTKQELNEPAASQHIRRQAAVWKQTRILFILRQQSAV